MKKIRYQSAVKGQGALPAFIGGRDDPYRDTVAAAEIRKSPAQIASVVSIPDHEVFLFFPHVTEITLGNPYFVSSKRERKQIVPLDKQSVSVRQIVIDTGNGRNEILHAFSLQGHRFFIF